MRRLLRHVIGATETFQQISIMRAHAPNPPMRIADICEKNMFVDLLGRWLTLLCIKKLLAMRSRSKNLSTGDEAHQATKHIKGGEHNEHSMSH
jgi:hypothetical protein